MSHQLKISNLLADWETFWRSQLRRHQMNKVG
jgi:hypothetical protein